VDGNPWTTVERLRCYFNDGKLNNMGASVLQWEGKKLFIEEAPEPNDVDWEFIHCSTKDKVKVVELYIHSNDRDVFYHTY
jgi:hypothetical protein